MSEILLAVNGTLMKGFALNKNLGAVHAEFIREAQSAAQYRMWSIHDEYPAMQRDRHGGQQIDVEIWKLTPEALLKILDNEPPGLCLGRIQLIEDHWVFGMLGESYLCEGMPEITEWCGWRNYVAQREK